MLLLFGILTIKEFLTYRDLRRLHMKIAVCDDDIAELNNICEILNNYFEEKKYDLYISKFGSSVELASIIQKEKFDIYILDIVMPS